MKTWFWRRVVIVLLAMALPLSAISASLVPPCTMDGHGTVLDASQTDLSTIMGSETTSPTPCGMDQHTACANMGHSCASGIASENSMEAAMAPATAFIIEPPSFLAPTSFIPPLLERPPARIDFQV